jgi:hypothetical protein
MDKLLDALWSEYHKHKDGTRDVLPILEVISRLEMGKPPAPPRCSIRAGGGIVVTEPHPSGAFVVWDDVKHAFRDR